MASERLTAEQYHTAEFEGVALNFGKRGAAIITEATHALRTEQVAEAWASPVSGYKQSETESRLDRWKTFAGRLLIHAPEPADGVFVVSGLWYTAAIQAKPEDNDTAA